MNLSRNLSVLAILTGIILSANTVVVAQMGPNLENGFKSWGSYHGSSIDTTNTENGNWMLHVPLLPSVPQRGAVTPDYFLYATSKGWQTRCFLNANNQTICYWTSGGTGVTFQRSDELRVHRTVDIFGSGTGTVTYQAYGYTILSGDGATHQVYGIPGTEDANGDATVYESLDNSGYRLTLSNPDTNGLLTTGAVIDRHGNQYLVGFGALHCTKPQGNVLPSVGGHAPIIDDAPFGDRYCSQTGWSGQVVDANGNQMSFHGPGNASAGVDTVGRGQPLETGAVTSDFSGCVSRYPIYSAFINNYTGPNGVTQQIKSCYAVFPIQTSFNEPGVTEAQNYSTNYNSFLGGYEQLELVTVVLADGSKWSFDYDGFLNVTAVGLPTGGSINLTWTNIGFPNCNPPDATSVSRAVASRTLNDNNGHSSTWIYNWGVPANHSITNSVTDPLGNDTVHTFSALDPNEGSSVGCAFYETRTQNYQGTGTSRQLLRQTDTTYSSTQFGVLTSALAATGNVVPTSVQTTTYPGGKVSLVTKSYDPGLGTGAPIFGNVVTEKEYDWGVGTPGPLVKETDTTYQWQINGNYLTAHLVDLPASVIVKDGNGTRVAETDYVYDESQYLTASGISTQHVSAPAAVRGNLTTVKRWLNTSNSFVFTHTNWYDTGEVYQQTDALGNTTTHSYDAAYAGAYSTKTCNPLSQCVSGTYDFTSGLLTSFTDANSQSSNFAYDFMSRLTTAKAPPDPANNNLRAQTTFTYSAPNTFPLSITRQKSITNTVNDSATNYFDGLARGYQGQHVTPAGTATVNTVFDGLDRISNVTNPFYSTSDPTYGVTSTQYDALGRATKTTKQDGSIATVSYIDNCTIVTDEAGKQRRSCTNAAGRLISVDEPGDSTATASPIPNGGGLASTGYVTISGSEQTTTVQIPPSPGSIIRCPPRIICDSDGGGGTGIVNDFGTVSITVAGRTYAAQFDVPDTTATIAAKLSAAINADSTVPVTSTVSGATVSMTSRFTGSQTSYSLSVAWTWDSTDFASPSYTATSSGGVTGGTDGPPVFGGHAYTTLYSYDALGNLLKVTQQGGTTDQTKWRVRSFTYDSLSRLLTANNPESGTITYQYDNNGNVTSKTDARGVTESVNYDALDRVTAVSYSDGTRGAVYTYDQTGVWGVNGTNMVGRLALAYDGNHVATLYSYDVGGRIERQWDCLPSAWVNGANQGCDQINAQYDLAGDLTQLQYPDGRIFTYGYNSGDQLDQVKLVYWRGTGYNYNYWSVNDQNFYPSGAPKLATLGNGVVESTILNNRLQAQQDTVSNSAIGTLSDHVYSFGAQNDGNILSVADQLNPARTQSFTYDPLNRLATASESRWGLSFTYDPWGNFLQQTVTAGSANQHQYAALTNNRLANFTYDSAGNLLGDSLHQYVFDGKSQLAQVDSGATTYTYDTEGNRVRKDTGANYTEYLYFGGNIIAERDQAGNWSNYIYAGGKRIARTDNYDARLHVSATACSGSSCPSGQGQVWNLDGLGDLNGHTVQSGDKLFVRQYASAGIQAGLGFCFSNPASNGQCLVSYPAVTDQDGNVATQDSVTGSWHYRIIDLTPIAGLTISNAYVNVNANASSGSWNAWYSDIAVKGADGTVYPLYTRESSVPTSTYGLAQTNPTAVFEYNKDWVNASNMAQTTYYYHGDQIGSSRVMTSGGGWPVWQGTMLPFGEEYNPQITTNHYKFTGKERDTETGLDYFGARYYGNGLGRFITPDWAAKATAVPYADFADPQSLDLYTYVRNIPTTKFDADGHDAGVVAATLDLFTGGVNIAGPAWVGGSVLLPGILGGGIAYSGINSIANNYNTVANAQLRQVTASNKLVAAQQASLSKDAQAGALIKDGKDANTAATATIEGAIAGLAAGKYKDATDVQEHIDKLNEGIKDVQRAINGVKNAVGQKARDAAKEALKKATKEVKGHDKDLQQKPKIKTDKEQS
ncbi:MAG TPA: RHS repeat-associated core domain-containing protein [Candidatus Angelobacter sp.]|nr:RHS repeat-associated core domain-containing protein [Candidatus Angelobacter sp.]